MTQTIIEIIEKRLIPDEQAKKARGEVFTPLNIVRELLYGVRKSDTTKIWGVDENGNIFDDNEEDRIGGIPLELWRNPDTKWLDPANGIGNFPFIAFHMLDYQLKHHGTEESKRWTDEERRRHIVGEMLYMIEIDRGNVNTSIKIFRHLVPNFTANVYCGNTLTTDISRIWNIESFDVVMGNPPFQAPVVGKHFAGKIPQIWDKFVQLSLTILQSNGLLAFITPPQWRSPESNVWKSMTTDSQLVFLHILGEKDSSMLFKVGSRIDMYILQKTQDIGNSLIIDELNNPNVLSTKNWPFLPNYAFDEISKILTPKDVGIKILYSTAYHSAPSGKSAVDKPRLVADDMYKYPVIHNLTSTGVGIRYVRDNTKGHFGVPKVILNKNRNQYPINDFEGKYGMTEMSFAIPISSKKEGDAIVSAINTPAFKEIIKATKWGSFYTNYHMFEYFRPDFYKDFLKKKSKGTFRAKKLRNTTYRKQRQRAK